MTYEEKMRFRMVWISLFGVATLSVASVGTAGWWIGKDPSELYALAGSLAASATGLFWSHTRTKVEP